jgi:hypothetical protein
MRNFKHILFIFCFLLISSSAFSQACYKYHYNRFCADKPKDNFKIYGQSESALLEKDSTFALPIIFYGRKDYIVTVCTERNFYPVHYLIRDIDTDQIFYDNMEDDYYESIGFTIDYPRKVILEITLLAEGVEPSTFGESQACVGVNIQWRRTEKLGFRE